MSHNTDNCYVLNKNKVAPQTKTFKKTFSNKGLKNEINLLCKSAPKDLVLEQYLSVIKKEKARLKQRALKQKSKASAKSSEDTDSSSDLNMSVNLIEEISPTKKQKLEKYNEPTLTDYDQSEEEQAYLKFIHADEAESLPEEEVLSED